MSAWLVWLLSSLAYVFGAAITLGVIFYTDEAGGQPSDDLSDVAGIGVVVALAWPAVLALGVPVALIGGPLWLAASIGRNRGRRTSDSRKRREDELEQLREVAAREGWSLEADRA